MQNMLDRITEKKKKLDSYRPLPSALLNNLEEWYKIELTYTSNAIEGNTLSRSETALVVGKGITIGGKTIREHLEAINHADAFDYIKGFVGKKKNEINLRDILLLHSLILKRIDDKHAGVIRKVFASIAGSDSKLPDPIKVPQLMDEFVDWLHTVQDHPATIAADAHHRLVSIHPFVDGNGRSARLLMNLLLMQEGYPPAIIKNDNRKKYFAALEHAHTTGDMAQFRYFIYTAIEASLDDYLDAAGKTII